MTSNSMITLKKFASTYGLKIKTDSCGDLIIPGKPRNAGRHEDKNHIYDHGEGLFGIYYNSVSSSAKWTNVKNRLLAAGFDLHQDGDLDGILVFNPENKTQSKTAIREAGIRTKKVLTPEQHQRLSDRMRFLKRT